MRRWGIGALAVGMLLAAPSTSQAEVIGANLGAPSEFQWPCKFPDFCTLIQTRINGNAIRAPFTGHVTKWSVKTPHGTLWLQILHKRDNGKYKSLRSSDAETVFVEPGTGAVKHFDTHLRIHKGDYIGIGMDDFYTSSVGTNTGESNDDCFYRFEPGIADGHSFAPGPFSHVCTYVLLYNVKLVH